MDAPAEAAPGARHPALRLGGFVLTAAAVALALAGALRFLDKDEAPLPAASANARPAAFAAPLRVDEPTYDPRVPLYVVSSAEAKSRLERALARMGFIELHGGRFPAAWAITILGNGVTWELIEQINLFRIENGHYPFRVVDLTGY
jgi:hypothetical protein